MKLTDDAYLDWFIKVAVKHGVKPSDVMNVTDPELVERVLNATLGDNRKNLLRECLKFGATMSVAGNVCSTHDRSVTAIVILYVLRDVHRWEVMLVNSKNSRAFAHELLPGYLETLSAERGGYITDLLLPNQQKASQN